MCKKRKKKCDEVKPKCGDCHRLCLDCTWPAGQKANGSKSSSPGQGNTTDIAIRTHRNPILSPATTTTSPEQLAERARGLEFENDEQYNLWDRSKSPSWLARFEDMDGDEPLWDKTSLSTYVPQLLPQLTSAHDRALLNHYSTIVSSILSRRESVSNPYNHHLLPMAQSNELVLHCLLALSANHWRKTLPEMADRGIYHQTKATSSLAQLLPHVDTASADVALVASLLLCMTEFFDGTSQGWKFHLKGAKRLLVAVRNQQGRLMSSNYRFLLRLARFLDTAATTSTCRPPLIEEEEAEAETLNKLTASPDEEDSAVYGIPKPLFHLIDRINSLADKRKTRIDDASEMLFREEAAEVEEHINQWSYDYGGMSRATKNLGSAGEDVMHATRAFENAVRLRLHQIVEGYELPDPKVRQHVEIILEALQKIRYGSPLETCLTYPLVMAGGACDKLEHRAIIQDRLMVMERTCGFGYVYNARTLIERVWSRRDESEGTGAIVNWARIRYEEMHGLVIF